MDEIGRMLPLSHEAMTAAVVILIVCVAAMVCVLVYAIYADQQRKKYPTKELLMNADIGDIVIMLVITMALVVALLLFATAYSKGWWMP